MTRSIQVECGSTHVDGRPYCQGQNIQNEAQLQKHMELGLCDVRELGVPLQTEPDDPGELEINKDTKGKQKRRANVCSDKDQCHEETRQPGDISQAVVADANTIKCYYGSRSY